MSAQTEKVVILFSDVWLPYSPSVLNLATLLENDQIEVEIFSFETGNYFSGLNSIPKNWHILKISPFVYRLLSKTRTLSLLKFGWFVIVLMRSFKKNTRVVGVDSLAIFTALLFDKKAVLLSLEVHRDWFLRMAIRLGLKRVLIQTPERAQYLFDDRPVEKIYYFPNAPLKSSSQPRVKTLSDPLQVLYFGNVIASHGVESAIDAVLHYDSRAVIHVQGPVKDEYRHYLESKYASHLGQRLKISSSYLPQAGIETFISKFDLGLVFYDFQMIEKNDFNYLSSPSGKLFNYFEAALPVIGSDIVGLKPVRDHHAGVLISSLKSEVIQGAIRSIVDDYSRFSQNSFQASKSFDPKSAYQSFKKDLF